MSADFIDTNVFVYLVDEADQAKQTRAQEIVTAALATRDASISHQVVQETLAVITSKLRVPLSPEHAEQFFRRILAPLWDVMPSPQLVQRALSIQERYGYHFYDSLIIASALEAGCYRLLSEDFQHGQQIEGLTIENPFLG